MANDERVLAFIRQGAGPGGPRTPPQADPYWEELRKTGTEVWLEVGDLDEADRLWSSSMSGLAIGNAVLYHELRKGVYDEFIKEIGTELRGSKGRKKAEQEVVVEIAFILNARFALKLANRFGCQVCVGLHTDCSHDPARSVEYGLRLHEIDPEHFLIRLPQTSAGYLAARRLREKGAAVSFALQFSARQNALAAGFAKPDFVDLMPVRLGAYVAENRLGDGALVGERAAVESRRILKGLSAPGRPSARLIASGLHSTGQISLLAGVDVCCIPPAVAAEARVQASADFSDRGGEDFRPVLAPAVEAASLRIETLWDVPQPVMAFAGELDASPPRSAGELEKRGREAGLEDLFPRLSFSDLEHIAREGRIPRHARWQERIRSGKLAVDSLLNLAGLASCVRDQARLDDRIRGLLK